MLKSKMYEAERNIWLNGFIFWHLPKNKWEKDHFGYKATVDTGRKAIIKIITKQNKITESQYVLS